MLKFDCIDLFIEFYFMKPCCGPQWRLWRDGECSVTPSLSLDSITLMTFREL